MVFFVFDTVVQSTGSLVQYMYGTVILKLLPYEMIPIKIIIINRQCTILLYLQNWILDIKRVLLKNGPEMGE